MQIQNANVHTPRTMRGAPNPTRGFIRQSPNVRFAAAACHPKFQNARFATAPCANKCMKRVHAASAVAHGMQKSSFYHSFGRLTSAKSRKGCPSSSKICISPQFWTSDEHEVTKGLREDPANFHFTTVLDVRRARNDERVASAT